MTAASRPRPWWTSSDSCGLSIAGLTRVVVFTGLGRVGHVDDDHAEPVARCMSTSVGNSRVES